MASNLDTIVIKAPAGTKARWVKHAHPGRLGPWIVKMIDEPPDADRYLARFAARDPGSVVVLSETELRDVMRKAYIAGCVPSMTADDLRAWQAAMGYTYETASEALGMSRAGYAKLVLGQTERIDRRTALACAAIAAGVTEWASNGQYRPTK